MASPRSTRLDLSTNKLAGLQAKLTHGWQTMTGWYRPLAIAGSVQVITTAADVAVPVLGPVITAEAGVPASHVGYYASAVATGAVVFYLLGAGLTHRIGPVRCLQLGVALCALALLIVLTGTWWFILAAGLLLGLGFGTNAPASAALLHASVPPKRLTFAFSIKQAGMPAGAILAGLLLPVLAALWGWQAALMCLAGVGLLCFTAIQLLARDAAPRAPNDAEKPDRPLLDLRSLLALAVRRDIRRLMSFGALLAVVQGSTNAFLVTYLVTGLGQSLVIAGTLYALFQALGIPGRIASGWLADSTVGRPGMLAITAIGSAAAIALLSLLGPTSPLVLVGLCVAALGLIVGNWNGILIAEVTSLAPEGQVPEANNVLSLGVFAGFILGPLLFSLVASSEGGFEAALYLLAISALLSLLPLAPWRR